MFQITILFLYGFAAASFAACRLPRFARASHTALLVAVGLTIGGLILQFALLKPMVHSSSGFEVTSAAAISGIGLQLALIGLLAAFEPALRGLSAGLLLLAALAALATHGHAGINGRHLEWQVEAHILLSMFAWGLLTAGAIVALYALAQERRLHAAKLSTINQLFAPLETTENLLYGITATGFLFLALSVLSGFAFVDNLFAQHLAHKTLLSILALIVFGILLAGRHFAGWRGRRAIYLYLGGFALLILAYFGSRFVLEQILHRSWS